MSKKSGHACDLQQYYIFMNNMSAESGGGDAYPAVQKSTGDVPPETSIV